MNPRSGAAGGERGGQGGTGADPTDLSGLAARLKPASQAADSQPRGGVLRSGERWTADDVTDVPVVELPRVPPAAAGGTAQDDALLHGIGRAASAAALAHAAAATGQPSDAFSLAPRRTADPRVLERWQPGAWIGAQRLVLAASTEFVRPGPGTAATAVPVVENHEAQRLLLLWTPPGGQAPHPGRWPRQVLLSPVTADAAAQALLAARPAQAAEAPIWIDPEPAHVDWALAAEIALHHEPGLRPFQVDGLRAFIAAEREASFARVNDGYVASAGAGATARDG